MDDKDLLALFREEGKEHYAFNLIVQKYGERLYWHIRKMVASHDDANDLLQNSLVKAWRHFRDSVRSPVFLPGFTA
jgi:RNA polymerase sigma-70 factor (ECF subfamily)